MFIQSSDPIENSQDDFHTSCYHQQVLTVDERRKTYHYSLNIPTSAPNIALAVG